MVDIIFSDRRFWKSIQFGLKCVNSLVDILRLVDGGNNQIYPIISYVSKKENHETWCWFMMKIEVCINEISKLAIIL